VRTSRLSPDEFGWVQDSPTRTRNVISKALIIWAKPLHFPTHLQFRDMLQMMKSTVSLGLDYRIPYLFVSSGPGC